MVKRTGPRRRYDDDFKRKVVLEASAPATSVAEVALRHGLNANLVFNWRKKFGASSTPPQPKPSAPACQLVPVEVTQDCPPQSAKVALPQSTTPGRDPSEQAAAADHATAGMIEIALPCGSRVRCSSGIEPELLGEAVTALRPARVDGPV